MIRNCTRKKRAGKAKRAIISNQTLARNDFLIKSAGPPFRNMGNSLYHKNDHIGFGGKNEQ